MTKKIFASALAFLILSSALPALAQTSDGFTSITCDAPITDLESLLGWGACMIGRFIIPLLFAVALVAFIWGVLRYLMNAADSKERAQGRNFMIWGIVALFVMLSVWGLTRVLENTFNLDNRMPTYPRFNQ